MASPSSLGRYQLLRRFAKGGMAELFLARATGIAGFEKLVVVKRMLPHFADDSAFVKMFLNEARLAATIHHPSVVQVFDIGKAGEDYFFSMEYVHGVDVRKLLDSCIEQGEPLPLKHAISIAVSVSAGLHCAHEQVDMQGRHLGIVHRDVSPSNVLIGYDGGIKVADFGIATAMARTRVTRCDVRKGKVGYMSPEQLDGGAVDRRSDIFALGVLLHEMTIGKLFEGDNEFATINQIVNCDIEPPSTKNPDYPADLERIVLRALSRRPENRYQSAHELQVDLEEFARVHGLLDSATERAEFVGAMVGVEPYPSCDLPEPGLEHEAVVGSALDSTRVHRDRRGSHLGALLALGVVVALGLGLTIYISGEGRSSAASEPASTASPSVAQPTPDQETVFEVDVGPAQITSSKDEVSEPNPSASPTTSGTPRERKTRQKKARGEGKRKPSAPPVKQSNTTKPHPDSFDPW